MAEGGIPLQPRDGPSLFRVLLDPLFGLGLTNRTRAPARAGAARPHASAVRARARAASPPGLSRVVTT